MTWTTNNNDKSWISDEHVNPISSDMDSAAWILGNITKIKDETSSILLLWDDDIITARNEFFGDRGYAFNTCVEKFNQLPKVYRNLVTYDSTFPSPKEGDIVDHIRAYAQWNAWKALENVIIYLWTRQTRTKTIDINDPSTMPKNDVVRAVLDNGDTEIASLIEVQYNEYYKLAWQYLLSTEKGCHSLIEFKKLMKSVYNRYPEKD